ncbi:hypothetical protein, partial [Bacillus sp. SIMBA_005]
GEQARAREAYPDDLDDANGLGEVLAGAPTLLQIYRDAEDANPDLFATVRAAIDWQLCGLTAAIPEQDLLRLARYELGQFRPDLTSSFSA